MKPPVETLIYKPAKRGNVATLTMIAGPSGSGKTKSALRLARGLAGPDGVIGFCDTEHGRALYYADEFDFLHLELNEPFTPQRLEAAAVTSQKAGHAVWICDSFSHEHVGPGGVLDMQEENLQRMAKDDWAKREQMKYAAWIQPKQQHKHLLQRLWQLNCHIILCCHAEIKLELIKDKNGKSVPNPDRGYSPVCSPDIPYAMTVSFMLSPKAPGVPIWLKRFDKIEPLVDTTRPLDEDTGARIAAWARGDKTDQPAAQQPEPRPQKPPPQQRPAPARTQTPQTDGPPDWDEPPPIDQIPGNQAKPRAASKPADPDPEQKADRAPIIAAELVALYQATPDLAAHFLLVDEKKRSDQVAWLRKNRMELFNMVNDAVRESYQRHHVAEPSEPPKEVAT